MNFLFSIFLLNKNIENKDKFIKKVRYHKYVYFSNELNLNINVFKIHWFDDQIKFGEVQEKFPTDDVKSLGVVKEKGSIIKLNMSKVNNKDRKLFFIKVEMLIFPIKNIIIVNTNQDNAIL